MCNSATNSTPVAPRADDRDMQLTRSQRLILRVSSDAGADHTAVETGGFIDAVDRDGVFTHSLRSEIIADAADRKNQRVVTENAGRKELLSLIVEHWRDMHTPSLSVEIAHFAHAIAIVMRTRVREIFEGVDVNIQRSGSDFVQMGLPDMDSALVEQRDGGLSPPAERISQLRR